MPRETKAAKNARVGALLADYDAVSRDLRKVTKRAEDLKAEIRAGVTPGTYGEWSYSNGTPREMLDQAEAKRLLVKAGIEVPILVTKAPLVVTPTAATAVKR